MTTFEARPSRLAHDKYQFTCGRRGIDGWCRGHVGDATYLPEVTYPDGSIRSEWALFHPHGFYQDGDAYRVIAPAADAASGRRLGRKEGRRARPGRLQVVSGTQQVYGQSPMLPAMVWCPACDRQNRVPAPTLIG